MTTSDVKKARILAGLLTIAGFTWFVVFGTRGIEKSEALRRPNSKIGRELKDPTIRIASIEKPSPDSGGQKNIFQYRLERLPLSNATIPIIPAPKSSDRTSVIDRPPLSPQREPSKTFKYDGFSKTNALPDGRMLASLSDGGNVYTVRLGECLLGQYCVRELTESMITIEDLQLKQRLTFPRTQP